MEPSEVMYRRCLAHLAVNINEMSDYRIEMISELEKQFME